MEHVPFTVLGHSQGSIDEVDRILQCIIRGDRITDVSHLRSIVTGGAISSSRINQIPRTQVLKSLEVPRSVKRPVAQRAAVQRVPGERRRDDVKERGNASDWRRAAAEDAAVGGAGSQGNGDDAVTGRGEGRRRPQPRRGRPAAAAGAAEPPPAAVHVEAAEGAEGPSSAANASVGVAEDAQKRRDKPTRSRKRPGFVKREPRGQSDA